MLAAWGGALPARAASPISSEFTYQGRLSQAGEPCTGAYDLQFALYDASEGGNAVGQTLLLTNVSVTDGLFTAVLDFGPEVFDGEARWLEISVRAGDSPEAVILSPRQALMPKPYAIHAANAATALVAASAESVAAGAIQAEALAPGAVVSNTLAAGAVSAAHLSPSLLSTLTDTPYLRATDFGAAGDGVTDDTAALQAALNAMAARQRALYIPAGKYKLTGKLTVPAPDYLGPTATLRGTGHFRVFGDGPGTQLEWATLSKGVGMTFANYQQGLTLEGLKFLGPLLTDWDEDNSSRAISAGLSATTSSGQNIRIKDCAFLGWDTACVLSNYWGVFYEGNTFTSNRVAAVVNACNHGVEMRNNNISGSFIPGDQLCGAGIVYVKDWFGDAIGWISGDQAIHANNIIYGCVTGVWNADLTLAVDGDHYGSCGVFGLITERGAATTYRGVYTLDQIPVMTNGWAAQFEMTSEAAANVSWIGCWPTGWRRLYNVVGTNYVAPPAFEQTLYGLFNGTNAVKSVPWRDVIRWNNVGNLGFSSEPELYWVLNTPSMRVNQLGLGTNGAQIHSTYPDSSTALFLGYDSRPFQIRGWTPDLGTPSVASILPRSGDWSLTPIWRDGGPHSALTVDAFSTNSGAAAGSTLLDLKSNGISKFSVSQDGAITWNGETRTAWPAGSGSGVMVSGPMLAAITNDTGLVTIGLDLESLAALNSQPLPITLESARAERLRVAQAGPIWQTEVPLLNCDINNGGTKRHVSPNNLGIGLWNKDGGINAINKMPVGQGFSTIVLRCVYLPDVNSTNMYFRPYCGVYWQPPGGVVEGRQRFAEAQFTGPEPLVVWMTNYWQDDVNPRTLQVGAYQTTSYGALTNGLWLLSATAFGYSNVFTLPPKLPSARKTPALGWSTWNHYGTNISEALMKGAALRMKTNGMWAAGYRYVNLDEGWVGGKNQDGTLQRNSQLFPSPMADYVAWLHEQGFLAGVYLSAGTGSCFVAATPGIWGVEEAVARQITDWGFDYVKYDNCGMPVGYTEGRGAMQRFAQAMAGRRTTYFSYSTGTFDFDAPSFVNSSRIARDLYSAWKSVCETIDEANRVTDWAEPGYFNDSDMLQIGRPGLSLTEQKTHFAMWCLLASPLIAGCSVEGLADPVTIGILTQPELIAINQDPLVRQARLVESTPASGGNLEVYAKELSDGSVAVGLLNRSESSATLTAHFEACGIKQGSGRIVRDASARADLGIFTNSFSATVPSHGIVVARISGPEPLRGFSLSLFPPDVSSNGWDRVYVDCRNQGPYAQANVSWLGLMHSSTNNTWTRWGYGVCAPSRLEWYLDQLPGQAESLSGQVALDTQAYFGSALNASVSCSIWADGEQVWASGPITRATPLTRYAVDLRGKRFVELRVDDGGVFNKGNLVNWASPRIYLSGSRPYSIANGGASVGGTNLYQTISSNFFTYVIATNVNGTFSAANLIISNGITLGGETRTNWPESGGVQVTVSGPGLSASTNNNLVTITAETNTSLALNARDFGAVGDGVADDTAALQAALDAMVERSAMLQVPPGDYKLTGKLTIPPALDAGPYATEWRTGGFTVRGAGLATRFYWPELDSGVGMDFAYGHHGLTIEGIQFIGPLMANWDTNNHSQAISTGNPNWSYTGQDIRIKDCIFIGWETACVLSNYWNVYYAGNRFSSNRLGAIYSAGCHVVEVRNNTIQGSYNPEDSPCETGVSYVMTDYGSGPISGDTAIHFNNRITGCVTGVWNADLVLTVQGDFYQDCGVYGAITAKGAATAYQGLYSLDQQPSLTIGQPAQFYLTSEAAPTVSFLGCWLTDRRPVFNVVGNDYASPVVLDQSYTGLFNGIHPRVAELPIRSTNVPSHMNAPGEQGQIAWDGNYVYLCVGKDTWKRAALSSW